MGPSKQTTETTLPPASAGEKDIINLLRKFAKGGMDQLGDLGGLARGDMSAFGPTQADRDLVAQNIGFTADISRRSLEDQLAQMSAGLDEQYADRGISGASGEAFDRAILKRDALRQIANQLDQSRIEGNQALMNLPGQRAGIALNANQLLYNRILGGLQPALAGLQTPRLAQAKTTQKSTPGGMDYFKLASRIGAGIATGGVSEAAYQAAEYGQG